MDNWTQMLSQINQIRVANVQDNIHDIKRSPGLFKKVFMTWENNTETLFQFKEIYTHRLRILQQAFQSDTSKTIEDLNNNEKVGEIIGMFKRIQAKRIRAFEPEYLEKYDNKKPIFSDNDTYELEDETGKLKLEIRQSTKINGSSKLIGMEIPYGVIIKCKGEYNPKVNRFIVSNVETPTPAPQHRIIIPSGMPKYMGVLCEPTFDQVIEMRDIVRISVENQALNLCELVIIGGVNYESIEQIRNLDEVLFQLGAMIDTFIVPSGSEINGRIYPQMPLHKSFLHKCYLKSNVTNCANPQLLKTKQQNLHINTMVSCGENLLNLKVNCNVQDQLELMKMILEYRHMCPSSVFSLPIQSYNYDPLILEETPHLMIHGKCEMFLTQFYERQNKTGTVQTRLVGLAKGDFVQIDLTSSVLQAKKRKFDSFRQ